MRDLAIRVMELQKEWTDRNSPAMQQRGMNIRVGMHAWIKSKESLLKPKLGAAGADFSMEGRDGTGRKTEIPWVRFFSKKHSPSATNGWYCVYLFEADGEGFYLALAHGSTRFIDGEFKPRSKEELGALVTWARGLLDKDLALDPRITKKISLGGKTKLGPAYERSTVAAIRYPALAVPSDEQLADDAAQFAGYLGKLYEAQDLGRAPEVDPPEIAAAVIAIDDVARPLRALKSSGQGFGLGAPERRAVELRAMALATEYLVQLGYQTKDVSASESYDIHATKGQTSIYVEVKGTTAGPSQVVLTAAEVALNKRQYPNTALIVVYGINLDRANKPVQANGGVLYAAHPWRIDELDLSPLSYRYSVPVEPTI